MCKTKIVEAVRAETGLGRQESIDAVAAVFNALVEGLKQDKIFVVRGFGTFRTNVTKARTGRNPKTMVECVIEPRVRVSFKAGDGLRASVNEVRQ